MRKIKLAIGVLALCTASAVLWFTVNVSSDKSITLNPSVLGDPLPTPVPFQIVINKRTYSVDTVKANASLVSLYANFTKQTRASDLLKEYGCDALVNGGFYTEDLDPTGLFVSGGATLFAFQKNSLLNGVLSINYLDIPRITREAPVDSLRVALQTGPILFENGSASELSLVRDKQARRMVAAITGSNDLVFLAIYSPGSSFDGPYLEDLPQIVNHISEELNLNIADAINLDGGSASAFYSENTTISELSPIGSFFCVK